MYQRGWTDPGSMELTSWIRFIQTMSLPRQLNQTLYELFQSRARDNCSDTGLRRLTRVPVAKTARSLNLLRVTLQSVTCLCAMSAMANCLQDRGAVFRASIQPNNSTGADEWRISLALMQAF